MEPQTGLVLNSSQEPWYARVHNASLFSNLPWFPRTKQKKRWKTSIPTKIVDFDKPTTNPPTHQPTSPPTNPTNPTNPFEPLRGTSPWPGLDQLQALDNGPSSEHPWSPARCQGRSSWRCPPEGVWGWESMWNTTVRYLESSWSFPGVDVKSHFNWEKWAISFVSFLGIWIHFRFWLGFGFFSCQPWWSWILPSQGTTWNVSKRTWVGLCQERSSNCSTKRSSNGSKMIFLETRRPRRPVSDWMLGMV